MAHPMSLERFLDRWRFFSSQPQQLQAVEQLHDAIAASDDGEEILDETAPWAQTFSQNTPPAMEGLDPRGTEEAGLIGPAIAAPVRPGDSYLLVKIGRAHV